MKYASLVLSLLFAVASTAPANKETFPGYIPFPAFCPWEELVRPAVGLSAQENAYRTGRKAIADIALRDWLLKTNPAFPTDKLPTVYILAIHMTES